MTDKVKRLSSSTDTGSGRHVTRPPTPPPLTVVRPILVADTDVVVDECYH